MRVAYLKPSWSIHDDRFVAALHERGHQVDRAIGSGGSWTDLAGRTLDLRRLVAGADVVQVGPLELLPAISDLTPRPRVVATCWGRDAFEPMTPDTRTALRDADVVICDCAKAADQLVELGVSPDRVARFPWGIDLETFVPGPVEPTPERARFVTTRALTPFYRHDLVLEAVAALHREGAGPELALYGSGPDRGRLVARAGELGIEAHVAFHEPIDEDQLVPILGGATAWVNAAPLDGICLSLLQAMAVGCGVVTTDLPCAREAAGPYPARFFTSAQELTTTLASARRPAPGEVAEGRRWLEEFADWKVGAEQYARAVTGR